jgi:citrate lyase subunit beta/citryl-CoA lyase
MRARSWLFVPGDRPERFDKALAAGADRVIVDLEDAVAPADKAAARDAVSRWVQASRPVALRINSAEADEFEDDLALCALPGIQAVVLPKAERLDALRRVAEAAPQAALLPLVESARGYAAREALAAAPGVERLLFGSIDFQLDLGCQATEEELLPIRFGLVLASRLAGIAAPIDGVTPAIDDAQLLRQDAARARRLGFAGKLCIHPRQLAPVHEAFAPSEAELAWARRVVEAAAAADGAAVKVDGQMVDRPVLLRARALLSWPARSLN